MFIATNRGADVVVLSFVLHTSYLAENRTRDPLCGIGCKGTACAVSANFFTTRRTGMKDRFDELEELEEDAELEGIMEFLKQLPHQSHRLCAVYDHAANCRGTQADPCRAWCKGACGH